VNFSVEIYLRFNLGPLHAPVVLVKDVAEKHGKEFLRKAIDRTSIAISSFRKKSELNCHILFKFVE
jgi:hypothetical protein